MAVIFQSVLYGSYGNINNCSDRGDGRSTPSAPPPHSKYVAGWNYEAHAPDELTLLKGDVVVVVVGKTLNEGWVTAEVLSRASFPSASPPQLQQPSPPGKHGLVPLSYLRPLSSTRQKATQPAVKGGKYGCEWGCGFKDDAFDLVANHERTCAMRDGHKQNVPSPAPNKAKSKKDSPGSAWPSAPP